MLFNLTIFGIIEDVATEIDYKGDVLIDVTSFELPEITGFEFDFSVSLIPNSFNSDEIEVEILTSKIERDTTEIVVDDGSLLTVDENYWLGNELIYVSNIATNTITIARGQSGTIPNRYQRNDEAGIKLYLNKYPVWFTGKLVKIENQIYNIIQYAIIESEPIFQDGLLKFQCSDLTKTLDNDLPEIYTKNGKQDKFLLSSMGYELLLAAVSDYGSYDYIPEIFSFMNILPLFFSNDVFTEDTIIDFTKISTYKELIELCLKLSKSILYLNKKTGKYELKALSPTLSFQTNSSLKMLDYLDVSESYVIKKQENIKKIVVSYNDKKNNPKKLTFNITNVLTGKTLDINLSAFTDINYKSIFSMVQRYFYDTGFIYAVVEIPSSEIVLQSLNIGEIYQFTDVLMFSFQDITNYCMFLGSDNNTFKFAILKNYEKTLISPAIPVKYKTSNTVEFGWVGSEFSNFLLSDFLNFNDVNSIVTIENAMFELNSININYFEIGDNVILYDADSDIEIETTITDITDNVVEFSDSIPSKNFWLFYDDYANANTRQKKFFYLNINNY